MFDYWARNRTSDRFEGKHVAVLIAETARGRFRRALEALAEYVPLIVIELRLWKAGSEIVAVPDVVIKGEGLEVSALPEPGTEQTPQDWEERATEDAWAFHKKFIAWARRELSEDMSPDYSPKAYIGVRFRGKVWAPLWLKKEGSRTYLHDPDGVKEQEPSPPSRPSRKSSCASESGCPGPTGTTVARTRCR